MNLNSTLQSAQHQEPLDVTAPHEGGIAPLTSLVDLLVVVARADGRIDELEAEGLESLIQTAMRSKLSPNLVHEVVRDATKRIKEQGAEVVLADAGRELSRSGKLRSALAVSNHDGQFRPRHTGKQY